MNAPLVSIVIPIYNVEQYVTVCVESIKKQTYENYEIILIDDGSTDNSGNLCDDLSILDDRIKVFHKLNGGLSSARNYGLKRSNGKYVIFLDSDDFWNNDNILSAFVREAEKNNLDVVRGEYYDVDNKGRSIFIPEISKDKLFYKNKIFSSFDMINSIMNGRFFTWLFFFKKESIKDLLFDEKRKFQEDIDFAIRYFNQDLRCGYLPIQFYAYRHRDSSIISTPRLINISDSFALSDIYYEYAHKVNDKRLSQLYLYNGIMMYYWTLETVASDLYIDRYNEIDKIVDLKKIQIKVHNWISELPKQHYPIHLYVKPYIGVRLFRMRWFIGRILRKIHLYKFFKMAYV